MQKAKHSLDKFDLLFDVKSKALIFHTTLFNSLNWINESVVEILIQYLLPLRQILSHIIFPKIITGSIRKVFF